MDKKDLRNKIKNIKRQFTSEQLDKLSLAITSNLLDNPKVKSAKSIILYYSLPDEVNTHDLIDILLKMNKRVYLPKVIGEGSMEIRSYLGLDSLNRGAFHIMEPSGNILNDYSNIDIIVVPGLAFDRLGNRLGRGKGFYDRFLAKVNDIYKIGLCFPFQIVDKIPTDAYDVKVNIVLCQK